MLGRCSVLDLKEMAVINRTLLMSTEIVLQGLFFTLFQRVAIFKRS